MTTKVDKSERRSTVFFSASYGAALIEFAAETHPLIRGSVNLELISNPRKTDFNDKKVSLSNVAKGKLRLRGRTSHSLASAIRTLVNHKTLAMQKLIIAFALVAVSNAFLFPSAGGCGCAPPPPAPCGCGGGLPPLPALPPLALPALPSLGGGCGCAPPPAPCGCGGGAPIAAPAGYAVAPGGPIGGGYAAPAGGYATAGRK
ncbi:unnamed protein product [Caenorhabditis auriculariae]|uniref:Uncharacterized protein n=1 Tax=Caenorhabditis auriculariae TaxID=2777116 RepID=A0A8S1GTV9_9PELO|nr:unnamed protein product [Caenorhabditis auriculariae]